MICRIFAKISDHSPANFGRVFKPADESERQAARVATERVETRIALYLAECMDNSGGSMEITLPMSRKDLASYLGTTPETVSRKLAELEAQGYIQQISGRKIRILDLDGLLE